MIWGVSESRGAPYLAKKHPGWRKLTGMFFEKRCHPRPFLSQASKTKQHLSILKTPKKTLSS
jgi:hypothetical protein